VRWGTTVACLKAGDLEPLQPGCFATWLHFLRVVASPALRNDRNQAEAWLP
jgi:hypothetical protein